VFVMWNPKLIPAPKRVNEPVQLIDVMPTVLDLLDLGIPDVAQGQSLAPFVKGRPFQRRSPVITSRFAHPEAKLTAAVPESRIDSVALLDANWKLIYRQEAKRVAMNRIELYGRRGDRGETRNIAEQHPAEVGRMVRQVSHWMDAQAKIRHALEAAGEPRPIGERSRNCEVWDTSVERSRSTAVSSGPL